jgi:hypothetical protein
VYFFFFYGDVLLQAKAARPEFVITTEATQLVLCIIGGFPLRLVTKKQTLRFVDEFSEFKIIAAQRKPKSPVRSAVSTARLRTPGGLQTISDTSQAEADAAEPVTQSEEIIQADGADANEEGAINVEDADAGQEVAGDFGKEGSTQFGETIVMTPPSF